MNTDTLLTRIRLEQRSLIDINKKLYELEHLLPAPAPEQFIETAKSAALLSERSTAQLRNFLFTVCGGMPLDYEKLTHKPCKCAFSKALAIPQKRLNSESACLSPRYIIESAVCEKNIKKIYKNQRFSLFSVAI